MGFSKRLLEDGWRNDLDPEDGREPEPDEDDSE
jgi:hypothetical protein